jgi:sugar lactone lactonase YvrE
MFLVSELCFFYYNIDINQYKFFFAAESSIFQSRWVQNALTVAGGNEEGNKLNQLSSPYGMFVDDNQTIYVADCENHRIVEWKYGATNGQVIAGGNGPGPHMNQLKCPTNVIVDKETNNIIICDHFNFRVVRWPHQNGANGQIIIPDIACWGLAMDNDGHLYVSEHWKHAVGRWGKNYVHKKLVAGGNGQGNRLDQLDYPSYIFVDEDHSVYVSDYDNDRVMKWMKDATEGFIVAGGQGRGNGLTQLSCPQGVIVDHSGTVYVADSNNHRVMGWPKGATQGYLVVGGHGVGNKANQLNYPFGLSFDRQGNLYVVDKDNHRIQRFDIDQN